MFNFLSLFLLLSDLNLQDNQYDINFVAEKKVSDVPVLSFRYIQASLTVNSNLLPHGYVQILETPVYNFMQRMKIPGKTYGLC